MSEEYWKLYEELTEIRKELLRYYNIDKIKWYSVYVWNKDESGLFNGENLFDIGANEIIFYNKGHKIIEEALPVINSIQCKLKEIENLVETDF